MSHIRFPLNRDAVAAADDEFYRRHPEMVKNGVREPLHATSEEHAEMREEWRKLYREMLENQDDDDEADDDKVDGDEADDDEVDDDRDPANLRESCTEEESGPECTPIKSVDLFSVEYLNDHGKLKDYDADWKNLGAPYGAPEWTAAGVSHPITVTMDEILNIRIEYAVSEDDACPEAGTITGTVEGRQDIGPDAADFAPSTTPTSLPVTSNLKLAKKLADTSVSIDWEAQADAIHAMGTSENRVFVIFGPTLDGVHREDGATLKRMEEAVKWASAAGSVDEFQIVKHLFDQFDRYVLGIEHLTREEQESLRANTELFAKLTAYEWPAYYDDDVGAWPLAEFKVWGGECQAICRLIRAIMRQIGSKAKLEFVEYSADFSDPETPLEQSEATGPRADRHYVLTDDYVLQGETVWQPLPGEKAKVGFNNFEAYLKYTPSGGGPVRLFGGGVGLLEEGRNPLDVFAQIVEYEPRWRTVELPNGSDYFQFGRKVTRLHTYMSLDEWRPPP